MISVFQPLMYGHARPRFDKQWFYAASEGSCIVNALIGQNLGTSLATRVSSQKYIKAASCMNAAYLVAVLMNLLLAIFIPLISGLLIDPPPRRVPEDFRRHLPPSIRHLPDHELQRLPNDYVRNHFGPESSRMYRDFRGNCGGIPGDPGRARRAVLGGPLRFTWDIDRSEGGGLCKLSLLCPGRMRDRDLWVGRCDEARRYSRDVIIPRDIGHRRAGECFVQWSLAARNGNYHNNCVDLEIGEPERFSPPHGHRPGIRG